MKKQKTLITPPTSEQKIESLKSVLFSRDATAETRKVVAELLVEEQIKQSWNVLQAVPAYVERKLS